MLLSLAFVCWPVGLVMQEQTTDSEFADLGKLLLLGFLAAIVLGLAFTFVRLRLRDKNPPDPGFISINSFRDKE